MMWLTDLASGFEHPWLALPAVAALLLALLLPRRTRLWRVQWSTLALAFLLGAGPLLPEVGSPGTRLLFLVDLSDSVPAQRRAEALASVRESVTTYAATHQGIDARLAVMVFAGGQRILLPWSAAADDATALALDRLRFDAEAAPGPGTTDLAGALDAAVAYLDAASEPNDRRRLVLITDGNDSTLQRELPSNLADALAGIALDLRVIGARPDAGASSQWLREVAMPRVARVKEPIQIFVSAQTDSRAKGTYRLRVLVDGEVKQFKDESGPVPVKELPALPYPFVTPMTISGFGEEIVETGYRRYEIQLLAADEAIADHRIHVVRFFDPANVLVVGTRKRLVQDLGGSADAAGGAATGTGADPAAATAAAAPTATGSGSASGGPGAAGDGTGGNPLDLLESRLSALDLDVEKVDDEGFDGKVRKLGDYDLIILYDLPGWFFDDERLDRLKHYVERDAGGLLFVGGQGSFDFDPDYAANPALMELLPVTIEPEPATRLRVGYFGFLLDASGSMLGALDPKEFGDDDARSRLWAMQQSVVGSLKELPTDGQNRVDIFAFNAEAPTLLGEGAWTPTVADAAKDKILSLHVDRSDGTILTPSLRAVLAHAEDFLAGAEPTDGARIFILSDGELDNDDLADFDALLAGLDPRIQIATMTLGHGAPDDKMARLSKGGGGPARTLTDPSQLVHFDPGVDSERALLIAADCPPADPVLGKTFSGKECPGVYGFNNLRRRADTAASLSVPLSGGERAALVTFQTRRKGRVVVVGMDLHGQWSGPLFASQQAVPFVEQLIINTRRRPEQARRFALLFARRGLDDSVLLSLKTPTDRVGPFRLRFQAADADTDLDERRPHPLGFVESGLFELELSAGEVARDTRALDAAIYDNRDQPLEQARVWIENAVQRPERPQRPNLDLVVSLNQQTDTRHMRYLSEPDIVISPEMLDRLRAGGLDPVIVSYLERESGRYFPDLDDLYRQVGAILRKETGRHSLTDDERTALADLVQGLRTMPFEAPRPDVQWRSLYESPWRFALLPGLFGLMLLTNRARLHSWASGLPAQGGRQP